MEGSNHSKWISTDAILTLTSLPNIFMDMVASLTHDLLPKRYINRTRVHITAHATKFKTTKFNSGELIELFTKISTHKNSPLYGTRNTAHLLKNFSNALPQTMNFVAMVLVAEEWATGKHGNGNRNGNGQGMPKT